ncbi:MAG: hypothetical protein IH943_10440 [Acidobacteria bacterium]|nr:hypothetical protein [Acidobacteriota bacterium]
MSPTGIVKLLVGANLIVAIVGSVDAGISGEWDLFVLFAIGLLLSVALIMRLESSRPAIPVRRDLVAWLRDRASVSGESLTAVTDRAIATFADRYGAVSEVDEARQ